MTAPLASLPMYDRAEMREATDAFWAQTRDRLRQAGIEAPQALTRDDAPLTEHWLSPGLVLSQTCGLPYRALLHGKVQLVGTPDTALPGCPPGHYNSVFVVRQDETRTDPGDWGTMRFVFNDTLSQSGWAGPLTHVANLGARFASHRATGGHVISGHEVAEGRADITCIDAHTWRLMQRYDPAASALKELGRTAPTPATPLITRAGLDADLVLGAVRAALAALSDDHRAQLGIADVVRIPADAYLSVPTPEPAMAV